MPARSLHPPTRLKATAATLESAPLPSLGEALQHAIALLREEQLPEAEAALHALLERAPNEPNAQHFLGVLRHAQGRLPEALALIRASLGQTPDNAGAWNNLGNVLLAAGELQAAVQAYEAGVAAAPQHPGAAHALNNLSSLQRKQGRPLQAEATCRRALALKPEFGDAWYNLSLALMAQGKVHEGLLANSRAIAAWPRQQQARDQVIRALLLLGEREQAAVLYREWLLEEPNNPVVQHQLAACLGEQAPERASDAYVQQVFDAFAESFDAKLEKLDYRAPELVAQALAQVLGAAKGTLDIVDAGCGTGLCGPLVRPWARHLAGCDLSTGMLRRAQARQVNGQPVYDTLHQAELVHYLATQPEAFDAVVCADTLCYFGALESALAAAQRCLRPGGWLVFTVEASATATTHELQANGRYAHGQAYVANTLALAGLGLRACRSEVLRMEAARPVNGWLVTAQA